MQKINFISKEKKRKNNLLNWKERGKDRRKKK
jgi:hypothetical protein